MPTTPPDPRAIRVVLADDDPRVLAAAGDALRQNPDIHLVAEVPDGDHLREVVAREPVDVVVTDLGMPGGGTDLVRYLRAMTPPPGVVVVTAQDDPATCLELVEAGSRCIVSKYGVDVDLGRCVVRCHHGDVVLVGAGPASVLDHLLERAGPPPR